MCVTPHRAEHIQAASRVLIIDGSVEIWHSLCGSSQEIHELLKRGAYGISASLVVMMIDESFAPSSMNIDIVSGSIVVCLVSTLDYSGTYFVCRSRTSSCNFNEIPRLGLTACRVPSLSLVGGPG